MTTDIGEPPTPGDYVMEIVIAIYAIIAIIVALTDRTAANWTDAMVHGVIWPITLVQRFSHR